MAEQFWRVQTVASVERCPAHRIASRCDFAAATDLFHVSISHLSMTSRRHSLRQLPLQIQQRRRFLQTMIRGRGLDQGFLNTVEWYVCLVSDINMASEKPAIRSASLQR